MASSSGPPLGTLAAAQFPSLFLDAAVSGDISTEPLAVSPHCVGTEGVFPYNCCLICRAVACGSSEAPQTLSLEADRETGLQATL